MCLSELSFSAVMVSYNLWLISLKTIWRNLLFLLRFFFFKMICLKMRWKTLRQLMQVHDLHHIFRHLGTWFFFEAFHCPLSLSKEVRIPLIFSSFFFLIFLHRDFQSLWSRRYDCHWLQIQSLKLRWLILFDWNGETLSWVLWNWFLCCCLICSNILTNRTNLHQRCHHDSQWHHAAHHFIVEPAEYYLTQHYFQGHRPYLLLICFDYKFMNSDLFYT